MISTAEQIVRAIYADVARGDLAAVATRLAPTFQAEQAGELPFAGVWRGPVGFSAMGAAILSAYPGFAVQPLRFHACGSGVLVETRVSAPAAAGRPALDQPMLEYWRVLQSAAVECRPFYTDPAGAAASAATP